jgi:hypothetical protein
MEYRKRESLKFLNRVSQMVRRNMCGVAESFDLDPEELSCILAVFQKRANNIRPVVFSLPPERYYFAEAGAHVPCGRRVVRKATLDYRS